MSEQHRWDWVPLESIGGLRFDEPLPEDIGTLKLEGVNHPMADSEDNVAAFEEVGGKTEIYLEDGRVDFVICRGNFWFRGKNLVGLAAEDAMTIIGGNWVLDEEDEDERRFFEDDLEVTLVDRGGSVVTFIVNGLVEED